MSPYRLARVVLLAGCLVAVACGGDEPRYEGAVDCGGDDPASAQHCVCLASECTCPSDLPCGLECDRCRLRCRGAGRCDFEVGDGSTVECSSAGDCHVTCTGGACAIACSSKKGCTLGCTPDTACELTISDCPKSVTNCSDGSLACQLPCP
jgi:hypothetical protein